MKPKVCFVRFLIFGLQTQNPSRTRNFIRIHAILSDFEARGCFLQICSRNSCNFKQFSHNFAGICAYLTVFARICTYLHIFWMYLRKISQKAPKMVPKSSQNDPKNVPKMIPKSADPRRVKALIGGGLPPPYPPPPGPPRRNRWAQFVYSDSLRILGPNFGAHGPNPATGGFSELWVKFCPIEI